MLKSGPHLINLDPRPSEGTQLAHAIPSGLSYVGHPPSDSSDDATGGHLHIFEPVDAVVSLSVEHCSFLHDQENARVVVSPMSPSGVTFVNGKLLSTTIESCLEINCAFVLSLSRKAS